MANPETPLDRREFFALLGRGALALGLGAAAAVLGARAIRQGQLCRRGGACSGCPQLARCDLPTAVTFRRTP
jgi:hypothetical protein